MHLNQLGCGIFLIKADHPYSGPHRGADQRRSERISMLAAVSPMAAHGGSPPLPVSTPVTPTTVARPQLRRRPVNPHQHGGEWQNMPPKERPRAIPLQYARSRALNRNRDPPGIAIYSRQPVAPVGQESPTSETRASHARKGRAGLNTRASARKPAANRQLRAAPPTTRYQPKGGRGSKTMPAD